MMTTFRSIHEHVNSLLKSTGKEYKETKEDYMRNRIHLVAKKTNKNSIISPFTNPSVIHQSHLCRQYRIYNSAMAVRGP